MHATLQAMVSMGLEVLLSILLAATLIYCVVLERRLASVRKGQDGLRKMIGDLNGAIANAGASLRALKMAAGEAAETLDDRLKRARALSDELSLLTNSGERIAQRFDRAAPMAQASTPLPSGSVMNRLKAVR
jgi:phage shock protein A